MIFYIPGVGIARDLFCRSLVRSRNRLTQGVKSGCRLTPGDGTPYRSQKKVPDHKGQAYSFGAT